MSRSRSRPDPFAPIREWIGPDGESWYGMHPLLLALKEHYRPDRKGWMENLHRRVDEIAGGERRLPDAVAERMLEIDAEQRANGAPDDNLAGLVELLQRRWAT